MHEKVWVSTTLTYVYFGGVIPELGDAIKDGDLYTYGKRLGRVLSVKHMGTVVHVVYLESTRPIP